MLDKSKVKSKDLIAELLGFLITNQKDIEEIIKEFSALNLSREQENNIRYELKLLGLFSIEASCLSCQLFKNREKTLKFKNDLWNEYCSLHYKDESSVNRLREITSDINERFKIYDEILQKSSENNMGWLKELGKAVFAFALGYPNTIEEKLQYATASWPFAAYYAGVLLRSTKILEQYSELIED